MNYTSCQDVGDEFTPTGWCAVTDSFDRDGLWGHCVDVSADPVADVAADPVADVSADPVADAVPIVDALTASAALGAAVGSSSCDPSAPAEADDAA